jgi:hypothetical protein
MTLGLAATSSGVRWLMLSEARLIWSADPLEPFLPDSVATYPGLGAVPGVVAPGRRLRATTSATPRQSVPEPRPTCARTEWLEANPARYRAVRPHDQGVRSPAAQHRHQAYAVLVVRGLDQDVTTRAICSRSAATRRHRRLRRPAGHEPLPGCVQGGGSDLPGLASLALTPSVIGAEPRATGAGRAGTDHRSPTGQPPRSAATRGWAEAAPCYMQQRLAERSAEASPS